MAQERKVQPNCGFTLPPIVERSKSLARPTRTSNLPRNDKHGWPSDIDHLLLSSGPTLSHHCLPFLFFPMWLDMISPDLCLIGWCKHRRSERWWWRGWKPGVERSTCFKGCSLCLAAASLPLMLLSIFTLFLKLDFIVLCLWGCGFAFLVGSPHIESFIDVFAHPCENGIALKCTFMMCILGHAKWCSNLFTQSFYCTFWSCGLCQLVSVICGLFACRFSLTGILSCSSRVVGHLSWTTHQLA